MSTNSHSTNTSLSNPHQEPDQSTTTTQAVTKSTYVSPDENGELPLEHSWDVYHIDPQEVSAQVQMGVWEPKFIATYHTVRDFWCIFNNITPPTFLPHNTFIYMFKHGISPTWESAENKLGGELSVTLDLTKTDENDPAFDSFDNSWISTLLAMIGEYFTDSDQINGVCCSSKQKFVKISLWLVGAKNDTAIQRIKNEWVQNNPQWKLEELRFKPFSK